MEAVLLYVLKKFCTLVHCCINFSDCQIQCLLVKLYQYLICNLFFLHHAYELYNKSKKKTQPLILKALKVPKCEIVVLCDFNDFYVMK
jgi:hypothetical protein